MGFFRSFYLMCYSPGSIVYLYRAGIWRAAWHTLLAALCCAALTVIIFGAVNYRSYKAAAIEFDNSFGGIEIYGNKILPARDQALSKTWYAAPQAAVIYVPAGSEIPDVPPEAMQGVVWTPEVIFLWQKIGQTQAAVSWMRVRDHQFMNHTMEQHVLNATMRGISSELAEQELSLHEQMDSSGTTIRISDSFTQIFAVMSLIYILLTFTGYFLLAFFICGIFWLFSRIFNNKNKNIRSGEYWVMLLYTGFPAMLLGSIISGLGFDISYYMVYIFGTVIYLIFVLARLNSFLQNNGDIGK